MDKDRAGEFGKWLTRKFLDLQSESGHVWTISEFAKYLGCPQQSVSRWMAGGSLPDSARAINRLWARFGAEVYSVLGMPIPGDGIEPRVYAKFLKGWNDLPPDLRKEVEEIFSTITPEEFAEFFKELIGRKLLRSGRASESGDDEHGEQPPERPAEKGAKRNKARLLRQKAGS